MPPTALPQASVISLMGGRSEDEHGGSDSNELPVISWAEYQRRVVELGEQLILVGGAVIDVKDLHEGEHKGGAVYQLRQMNGFLNR
eukprot:COSAG02_NODE_559_length_20335_cov_10.631894_4_plen_86_part_00